MWWQHKETYIHCEVKQQEQHIEVHPLLTKYAVTTAQGKLHALLFEREWSQNMEIQIHCELS